SSLALPPGGGKTMAQACPPCLTRIRMRCSEKAHMECSLPLFLGGGPGWGALLCLLLLSGCGPREPVAKKPAATEVSAPAPAPTIASAEKPAARAETLSLLGSVRSAGQAALSVRMPARIVAVNVREDDTVRKGQLLIVLDAQEIAAQRSTAEAGLQAAL